MTAKVLDGEAVAARVRSEVKDRVRKLRESGTVPGLGTILVGDDAPRARYVALKHEGLCRSGNRVCPRAPCYRCLRERSARCDHQVQRRPGDPCDPSSDPASSRPRRKSRALSAIDPAKDVDGIHPVNLGKLVMGKPGPLPCTPPASWTPFEYEYRWRVATSW